ncbi:His-Xaa-Ser repeat protein HxsA [Sphingomonas gilva]|nr:His-Xaa-Ser repeat protein HxsA [Sphingomonas gilva]
MAGIAPVPPLHAATSDGINGKGSDDPEGDAFVQRFAQDHRFLLAQHRSHSSHASHSSHRSGSSGRVRAPVYTPPARKMPKATPTPSPRPSSRNTRSTPPSSVLPSSPAIAPSRLFSSPSNDAISSVVRRVQLGLQSYGYYHGAIDGVVGKDTRAALVRFQTDFSLKVTGTITPEVLDAFKIAAQ